ncbi:MAG: hypothetical protein ABJA64_00975 [Candidatus Saccharibacteria bacterium]
MSDFELKSGLVMSRLRSDDESWSHTPDYATFNQQLTQAKIDQVYAAILAEGTGDSAAVEDAYTRTSHFVERSFNMYENRSQLEQPIERAFAVPMRIMRNDESYASEVLPFVPLLDPEFGVNSDVRQRSLVGLPPLILDTYLQSSDPQRRGALVLTPLFGDMERDLVTSKGRLRRKYQQWKLGRLASRNINETARFIHEQLGASVAGLGAIIPSVTKFGTTIKQEGLTTTTGHGGTVHLIVETAKKIINDTSLPQDAKIGVIGGAGSIGYSSVDVIANSLPEHRITTYDKNEARLQQLVHDHPSTSRINIKNNALDVLRSSHVIITAVTTKIDLDANDPNFELDLRGKYIIDDSQPGCFDRDQVEARGGKLLWVVGEDGSADKFLTRDNGYNFGDEAGIRGTSAIWGCEAEAGVIAASGEYHKALRERVNPRHARIIGELCTAYSVSIAPYQSFGQPVQIG